MTHGVDGADVVWADVAVVDRGVRLRDPVRLCSVRVSSDLRQQPELHRTTLIIPPEEQSQRSATAEETKVLKPSLPDGRFHNALYLMNGFKMREVYGLLMLWSTLLSAPISRCQKDTEFCWTPLLLERLVCTQTHLCTVYISGSLSVLQGVSASQTKPEAKTTTAKHLQSQTNFIQTFPRYSFSLRAVSLMFCC